MRILILMLAFKGLGFSQRSLYVNNTTNELVFSVIVYHVFVFDIEYLFK